MISKRTQMNVKVTLGLLWPAATDYIWAYIEIGK